MKKTSDDVGSITIRVGVRIAVASWLIVTSFSSVAARATSSSFTTPVALSTMGTDQGAHSLTNNSSPHYFGWPRQYFDLRNDSHNLYETMISPSNVATLAVAWSSPLDSPVDPRAGPIVVGRTVYIGTRSDLLAFDARNGDQLWSFGLGKDAFATGIAHWHNLVYVTVVRQHAIYAVNAKTGTKVWSLSSQVGTSGPTVIGNVLLFNDFGQVRAVHAGTGDPVWTAELADSSFSFPALADGTIFVAGTTSGKLFAIDLRTGNLVWTYTARGNIDGSIALRKGIAYFGSGLTGLHANVFAVNTATHQRVWRTSVGNQVVATPSIAGHLVYVSSYDDTFYAFHAQTGSLAWSAAVGRSNAAATIANGIVYFSGIDGFVHAFDQATGDLLWSFQPPGEPARKIAVAEGSLYFGNDLTLFAMRLPPPA